MNSYNTDAWESLFVAEAGVAAVLAGLLFVAVSINLAEVLQQPGLPGRAAEAVALLVGVLVACTLGLVPGQSRTVLGAELLATGLLCWSIQLGIHLHAARRRLAPSTGVLIGRIALAQAAVLALPIAGISLMLGAGGGLYWLVPAVILSVMVAVLDSWACSSRSSADDRHTITYQRTCRREPRTPDASCATSATWLFLSQ